MFLKNLVIKLNDKLIFQLFHPRSKMGIYWIPYETIDGNVLSFRLVNNLGMPVHPAPLKRSILMASYSYLCE